MQNSANPISSSLSGAFLENSGHLWPASSRLSAGEQVTIASDDEFESAIALQQLKTSTNQSLQNSACTQLSEPNTLVSTRKKQPAKLIRKCCKRVTKSLMCQKVHPTNLTLHSKTLVRVPNKCNQRLPAFRRATMHLLQKTAQQASLISPQAPTTNRGLLMIPFFNGSVRFSFSSL